MISATFRDSFHLSFTIHKSSEWGGTGQGKRSGGGWEEERNM